MKTRFGIAILLASCLSAVADAQISTKVRTLPPLIQSIEIISIRTKTAVLTGSAVRVKPTVTGGMEATARITLVSASSSGVSISVATSNTAVATAPVAVWIPAGATSETFPILSKPVATSTAVTITASRNMPGDSKSTTLTVIPPAMTQLHLDASTIHGGLPVTGHVTFTGPPPPSPIISTSLTSSDTSGATVPYSLTLPQGRTVADFTVQTKGQADPKTVTISASYGGETRTANLKIQETKLLRIGTLNAAGTGTTFGFMAPPPVVVPVTLTGAAPQGGATIAISTNDPVKFPVPASIVIPAGQDKGPVSIHFPQNVTTGSAAITASYRGLSSTVNFSLIPPDIRVNAVEFRDRFGNLITRPPDTQPFKMCAKISRNASLGNPNTTLQVSYKTLTGAPTSSGRTFELPAVFQWSEVQVCTDLPGLEVGHTHEVTVKADSKNVVEENNEGNNTFEAAITR